MDEEEDANYLQEKISQKMSNQDAKKIARQIVQDLLSKYPPGFVVMVLRQLKIILRATKDLTQLKDDES